MKVLTREEATTLKRGPGPWSWPELVHIMVSNTYDVSPGLGRRAPNGDPFEEAMALRMLETLYDAGFAVVKLEHAVFGAGGANLAAEGARRTAEASEHLENAIDAADGVIEEG